VNSLVLWLLGPLIDLLVEIRGLVLQVLDGPQVKFPERRWRAIVTAALLSCSVFFISSEVAKAEDLPRSCRLETPATPRPEWCPAGWSCRPRAEDEALGICITDLERVLADAARARKWGWTAGAGPFFGAVPTTVQRAGEPDAFSYDLRFGFGVTFAWGRRLP
jgi:hypothetical protein